MADIKSCIRFTNENTLCFLATVEGNQPRVRALGFWFADETGFYFQVGGMKSVYKQLQNNPNVEACYYKHENPTGTMLRISGKVEFVEDRNLKERLLRDRPFLKEFGLTMESSGLGIFRIAHGEAHFWTMQDNMKPKEIVHF
jgi:pyridoxamine 5'-phosphate oxidase